MKQITTINDIKKLGTILSVWAHPDDESFLAAGVMAAAAQNGQKVACITATKGELGSQNESKWPSEKLAEIRSEELKRVLDIIGCKNHSWLGYDDGNCSNVESADAVSKIQNIINILKPTTILTFGPDGWTGHTDHSAVSNWVKLATQGSDIDVFHVVHTQEHYDLYYKPADIKFNMFFNIEMPPLISKNSCDVYFEMPDKLSSLKYDALRQNKSQTEALFKSFDKEFLTKAFAIECFVKFKN